MGEELPTSHSLTGTQTLVTGGGGFIGSTLVRALLEAGADVRVLDNFATGNRANLLEVADHVEMVEGELRSYERVHAGMRGAEIVFHQAALPSVPRSVQDPLTTSAVNVEGTLNVLLAARDEGVRRVVFASSSSVYGDGGELPRRETQAPQPTSPYAVSKLAAERYCISFSRIYGIETVSLRYFNVFGPRQDPHSQYSAVVPRFISAIAAGRPVSIYGDGEQSRDFTYVSNVIDANLLAGQVDGISGSVINVATGASTTVNELADMIGAVLDRPVTRDFLPSRPAEVSASWADTDTARTLLGWAPSVSLREGLGLTAEAMTVSGAADVQPAS
jgi:UDP-N-acetylglucosamine/UDP-N-acetyl-alpha-D-glucosaminouronate 4-epimerase